MCLYPTFRRNKKYTATKKNGGNIPAVYDERVLYVPTGCGNCIECRKQKTREWQTRLLEDIKHNKNAKFITLTFNTDSLKKINEEESIQYKNGNTPIIVPIKELKGYAKDNAIAKRAVRLFLERWRKEHGKSLRHWLVTEIGGTHYEHIHLHGIVWTKETNQKITNIWQYGFTWFGTYVNERTINYTTKYIHKIDFKHQHYKSIILTSPGIGKEYTNQNKGDWKQNQFNGSQTKETYRTSSGHHISMPIYWRNKIYNDEEREKLWLLRLDKMERWVCGQKANISKDDTTYLKLLEYHRKINKQLGYGNNDKNWKRQLYENQRRELIHLTRMADPTNNTNQQHIDRNATDKNTTQHHKGLDWVMPPGNQPMIKQNELVNYYNNNINTNRQGITGNKIKNIVN